ncbi:phosphotransferase enzyme family protein [Candidatus Bipolaricaulota bacterium]
MSLSDQARRAAAAFRLPGPICHVDTHGEGLIHDTFVVSAGAHASVDRFILQRINQGVFADPEALMQNVESVVSHLQLRAIHSGRDPQREAVSLARTEAGTAWHESEGDAWRMFRYVEGTEIIDQAPTLEQAGEIGGTFGRFLDDLSAYPLESLQTVLPEYRDTERYLAALWHVVGQDPLERVSNATTEIAAIESRVDEAMRLQNLQHRGDIPLRVIHGDTKSSNVLLDRETGAGLCVIDLDTVMPGLLLHDIGDCVRDALVGNSQRRDSLSEHDLQIIEAIVKGFLSELSAPPSALEVDSIVAGIKSITLELGVRFLTDYLSGDAYFKTPHPQENLHRARKHLQLVQAIEASEGDLKPIIERWTDGLL